MKKLVDEILHRAKAHRELTEDKAREELRTVEHAIRWEETRGAGVKTIRELQEYHAEIRAQLNGR